MPNYEVLDPVPVARKTSRLWQVVEAPGRFLRWLTPGGQLQRWLKWCLTVAIMAAAPILLFAPLVSFLLKQLAIWMQALAAACEALLKAVGCIALVVVILFILIAGGTQVSRDMAKETGLDATFGRGTKGIHVVNAMAKALKARGVV